MWDFLLTIVSGFSAGVVLFIMALIGAVILVELEDKNWFKFGNRLYKIRAENPPKRFAIGFLLSTSAMVVLYILGLAVRYIVGG